MESVAMSKILLAKVLVSAGLTAPGISMNSMVETVSQEQATQVILGLTKEQTQNEVQFFLDQKPENLTVEQKMRVNDLATELSLALRTSAGQWD